MAIPSYDQFYRSILQCLSDGKIHDSKETITYCAKTFNLNEEERSSMLVSGKQTILANRVGWARTYLKKAGLINSPSRGCYQISFQGKKALNDTSLVIDNTYLLNFENFRNFWGRGISSNTQTDQDGVVMKKTPSERLEIDHNEINEQLADELMTAIMNQSPAFFERLVLELLEKMGYGRKLENPGEVTGKTGDEGIDGIIREDDLGFNKIYVQAKR